MSTEIESKSKPCWSSAWMASVQPGPHPAGFDVVATGDFTGNGTSDILWQNTTTGVLDEWQMSNGQWAASVDLGAHPGSGWVVAGVGDFFGNGITDILWTNSTGGNVQTDIWELGSNGQFVGSVQQSHPGGFTVVGTGDYNGDGTSDILWQNSSTGVVDEWTIINGHWAGSTNLGAHPGTNFGLVGTGDVLGNGTSDILFHQA